MPALDRAPGLPDVDALPPTGAAWRNGADAVANPGDTRLSHEPSRLASADLAAHALVAFQLLVQRYTGESEFQLQIAHAPFDSSVPRDLTVSIDGDPLVSRLIKGAAEALQQGGSRIGAVRFTWLAGEDASAGSLAVEVDPSREITAGQRFWPPTGGALAFFGSRTEAHWQLVLGRLASNLERPISQLAWLEPGERQRLIEEWSGDAFDPSLARDWLLHEIFERHARERPDDVAVECGPKQFTYGELERRANQLAHALRARGIGRGQTVGLILPRSAEVSVTQLGVLKSGAAYVPLDPDYPAERVTGILADAAASLLITSSALAPRHAACGKPLLVLDEAWEAIALGPTRQLSREETGLTLNDVAYIIFTSGSTGRPKGVQVEHRNVSCLVQAEGRYFQVQSYDRVYQGFSVAFDASVEETWLAFHAGATLVVGTREMMQAGPALAQLLSDARISVLSTVPTLLSILEGDIPTMRLLILGGESCPQHLVRRWARPGRRVVNTYGPTETTVVATLTECDPERPVTIGRPLPNYRTYILDAQLQPVPIGVPGELCIGGAGVARGYVGRDDLTAERFVSNPFAAPDAPRLYRSGDLVRYNDAGEIEFLGRIDAQVKIRGFRVELAEIESVLLQQSGVRAAAVAVRQEQGVQQLVGYVIREGETTLDEDLLRGQLRLRLPTYMVPALIEVVSELPTLPSGKVDRKRLPAPRPREAPSRSYEPPQTATEQVLAAAWGELFKPARVSLHDDFFLELGGHSLLAASMVSALRRQAVFRGLSVLDVYNHPTVHRLAAKLDADRAALSATIRDLNPPSTRVEPAPLTRLQKFLSLGCQTLSLYLVFALFSMQWLMPYFTYSWWTDTYHDSSAALVVSLGVMLGLYPAMLLLSIVVKWLVIGRFRPGVYRLWGLYYVRWWFVNRILSIAPIDYLNGTPLLYLYYRALGTRIGRNVYIGTDNLRMFDLISIGSGTSIGADTSLLGYSIENGFLRIGRIEIGDRCFIGARAVVGENVRMEDGASLCDQSMLASGTRVPADETWLGSPARRADSPPWVPREPAEAARTSRPKRFFFGFLHAVGSFMLPLVILLAAVPGILLMRSAGAATTGEWYLVTSPLAGTSFVVLLALGIVAVKWLLLGRVRPGHYPVQSLFYWRKWMVDQLMDLSLDVLGPLYATIYLPPWYRWLGARLGKNAEISTASNASPDLISLGDETFIADGVSFGAPRVERGYVTLAQTRVGNRAFIGNSAVLPAGTNVGESCLIGVLSLPPLTSPDAAVANSSWLGSPAVFLPQRQKNAAFQEEATFKPTAALFAVRAIIEFFRIVVPASAIYLLTAVLIDLAGLIREKTSLRISILLFPVLFLVCGVAASLLVVLTKWVLMGRYRPGEKPLWCSFVWLNEFVTALHEHIANPLVVEHLLGTPYAAWFFRAMGSRIGPRVYIDTTQFTEYDLIHIGADVALNAECTIQTHLFEDRVMKMSTIDIEERCSVGTTAVVLYDTRMEAGATLGALSLLMKGEVLPAATHWEGAPARPVAELGRAYLHSRSN
jgi:non-ribosomal peptide synthetase-like protein